MAQIELEECMMKAVVEVVEGEYIVKITVPNRSTNEWSLGKDESIAKGKVAQILTSYTDGLEYVQEQVRGVFAQEEDSKG